jgi:predicted deacylase
MDASEVEGSLIIIPSLNLPAALAGARLSPIDDCNLNREFPGNRQGSVTQRLAHFVTSELILRSDTVVDLHSGGRTLRFHPCMFIHEQKDAVQTAKVIAAAQSFGAPFTVVAREDHADVMIDDVVERAGKLMISSELGGSGIVTPQTVDLTYGGIYRLLNHLGHIKQVPAGLVPPAESRLLFVPGPKYFVHADDTVLFQPIFDLGQSVQAGEIFGYYHYIDRIKPATPVYAPSTGVLFCVNGQALVRRDDTVAVIAVPYES